MTLQFCPFTELLFKHCEKCQIHGKMYYIKRKSDFPVFYCLVMTKYVHVTHWAFFFFFFFFFETTQSKLHMSNINFTVLLKLAFWPQSQKDFSYGLQKLHIQCHVRWPLHEDVFHVARNVSLYSSNLLNKNSAWSPSCNSRHGVH